VLRLNSSATVGVGKQKFSFTDFFYFYLNNDGWMNKNSEHTLKSAPIKIPEEHLTLTNKMHAQN
jgi:hypothetical protein